MKKRKIPLRKCIVCDERKEKKELMRVVKNKEGDIFIDINGKANGRGAYICNSEDCFDKALKTKALNKIFKTNVSDEVYEELKKAKDKNE